MFFLCFFFVVLQESLDKLLQYTASEFPLPDITNKTCQTTTTTTYTSHISRYVKPIYLSLMMTLLLLWTNMIYTFRYSSNCSYSASITSDQYMSKST